MKTSVDIEKARKELLAEEEKERNTILISRAEASEVIKDSIDFINMCLETFEDEIKVVRNEVSKGKWKALNKKFKSIKNKIIVITNE